MLKCRLSRHKNSKNGAGYVDPNVQTAEEQSRAECDRQPTIHDGFRDNLGRRRARPEFVLPEGRAPNGYDHLLDPRAYSPNNRVRGFWDWDPAVIERDNHCTSSRGCTASTGDRGQWVDFIPPRTPSPPPEEGSLQAMMFSSIAETRPDRPGVPIFANNETRNNIGIRAP